MGVLDNAVVFGRRVLGLDFYGWQEEILMALSELGVRRNYAVRAPNGSGKDARIIAVFSLWLIRRYPKGRVIVTTKDARQLREQTWHEITRHYAHFGDCKRVDSEYRLSTPEGGVISGFTTDDPSRAEGYHFSGVPGTPGYSPLVLIINEAKTVEDAIFSAFARCSYNVNLEISTGGLMEGRFYEHFTSQRGDYRHFVVSLLDCPCISQEKIDQLLAFPGPDHPFTRSALYGEFMQSSEEVQHVFERSAIESNQNALIEEIRGRPVCGIDFGGGRDFNALVVNAGNFVPSGGIIAWREANEASAAGVFARHFIRLKLQPEQIVADSAGLGSVMCSLLAEHRFNVRRLNNCEKSPHPDFFNMGSYLWHEVARKVAKHEIKLPKHDELIQQLMSRRTKMHSSGKIWIEQKDEMRARGAKSPDIGDAFCLAFGMPSFERASWITGRTDNWEGISQSHGWSYTSQGDDDDDVSRYGRPGSDDESAGAFDYLNRW